MKVYIAHASGYGFKEQLYVPLRASALNSEHELNLPQEGTIEEITREMIAGSDVVVADVSHPSLGVGIEIGWANAAGVPVIAMHEKGANVSFSIDNAINDRFEYEGPDDMIAKLAAALRMYAAP
jgi:nucleoside 2-deoxyribosyltransferase